MKLLQGFKSLVVAWIKFVGEVLSEVERYRNGQFK
jgi:hypothetical protein